MHDADTICIATILEGHFDRKKWRCLTIRGYDAATICCLFTTYVNKVDCGVCNVYCIMYDVKSMM